MSHHQPPTNLNDAFNFTSTIPQQASSSTFSLECIYCNSKKTMELIPGGSFRRCLNILCRKNFQAKINPPLPRPHTVNIPQQKQRHPNDYIMYQQSHLLQQPQQQQYAPEAINANLPNKIQFSHPNYDPQIKYK